MNIDEIREQLPMITVAIFAVGLLFLLISLRFFRRSRKHPYWTQRRKAGQRGLQVFLLSAAIFTIGAIACSLSLIFNLTDSENEEDTPVVVRETVLVTAETLSTNTLPARTPQDQITQTSTIEETPVPEVTLEQTSETTEEAVEDEVTSATAFTPETTDSNLENAPTNTRTATASATQTIALTRTVTSTPSVTDTVQPSPTSEETGISDNTAAEVDTATPEPSPTPTQTASFTATTEPSATPTSTNTHTETSTATVTSSPTLTHTHTPTSTATLTSTLTPSPTSTMARPTLVSPFQIGRLALPTAMPDEGTILNIIQITDEYPSPLDTASRQQLPAGTQRIYFVVRYEEMKTGLPWRRVLLRDGQLITSRSSLWGVPTSGRAIFFFGNSEGFPPGQYEIQLFLGADNEFAASETVIVSE